ncbi:MAG: Asp-tRNA(Asn)/Glu-tRNA(Gln) amidotransferase GatCAB subunit A [SAR116 cluster bacterium]|nr:Asp-tRNA(Asn)/Glu-tRNA(Gln) amidotransferase GatCAB subunit A [SAR116 cluster bacterium]
MTEITKKTILEIKEGLKKRDFSTLEVTNSFISASEKNKNLNIYNTFTPEKALESSKISQKRIDRGEERLLDGIPIAIKDLFCTKDILTTASSKILSNFIPSYESTVTQKLWDAGALMLGKVSCDEFAMGSSNETSCFGNVINPWSERNGKNLSPGGSSGGSSSVVSSGSALAATGTDTGGSIRQPVAFCGVTGIKPSYGRCSRWGIVAFASSLDQAGPITKTVSDSALMLNVMSGFDDKDSTSADLDVPDFTQTCNDFKLDKVKIGIPKEYQIDGMSPEIIKLWQQGSEWLKDRGAEIVEVSLPHTKYALPTYYVIAPAEASSNLARYDGVRYGLRNSQDNLDELYAYSRGEGFGYEVQRRILIGTYVLSAGYYDAYYRKAQRVRNLIIQDFQKAFDKVDVLLTPTTPTAAFELGSQLDPISMYMNDVFTVPASLAGLPAMSVPSGLSKDGLPLGLQIIGNQFDENSVLKIAANLEDQARFPFLN